MINKVKTIKGSVTGSVTFYKICSVSGEKYSVTLNNKQLRLFNSSDRPLIQDALSDLTLDQREFLMSGFTPAEWENLYCEDNDEGGQIY